MTRVTRSLLLLAGALAGGCGKGPAADPPDMAVPPDLVVAADLAYAKHLVVDRPYASKAPPDYDASRPWPLVVLLHGLGGTGAVQDTYFRLGAYAAKGGYLFAVPDGTEDAMGRRFWNATNVCCDFYGSGVDDVAYLDAVIDDMRARYNVDRKRIYLVGHSNGGFMSYRYACDRADRVAAFVSLAGLNWLDTEANCIPSAPVAALQVHGDMDQTAPYKGFGGVVPSARASVEFWGLKGGCDKTEKGKALDVDSGLAGAETETERWTGCRAGAAELWTIKGGAHIPKLQANWAELVWGFLSAHPKP